MSTHLHWYPRISLHWCLILSVTILKALDPSSVWGSESSTLPPKEAICMACVLSPSEPSLNGKGLYVCRALYSWQPQGWGKSLRVLAGSGWECDTLLLPSLGEWHWVCQDIKHIVSLDHETGSEIGQGSSIPDTWCTFIWGPWLRRNFSESKTMLWPDPPDIGSGPKRARLGPAARLGPQPPGVWLVPRRIYGGIIVEILAKGRKSP